MNDALWLTTERVPDVMLRMPASGDAVGLARQAVSGVADALGMPADRLEDMKVAVTEACVNVIMHAYDDPGTGIMAVLVNVLDDAIEVTVIDRGRGLHVSADRGDGVGLHTIAALTDRFRVSPGFPGTRVLMRFCR